MENQIIIDETGNQIATIHDFWQWAYSNVMTNTERGIFAEYIVSRAVGAKSSRRVEWEAYDILTPEGIAVEVKSSAYLQSWQQKGLSKIIFGIQPTHEYDYETKKYDTNCFRHAQVYVFCVENHKDKDTVNPMDLRQWDFYVLPTSTLDKLMGAQKTISLSKLLKIGARKCSYGEIKQAVCDAK